MHTTVHKAHNPHSNLQWPCTLQWDVGVVSLAPIGR